jgi:tripartite-type tricarboxylate transporter receptor subunit TctC
MTMNYLLPLSVTRAATAAALLASIAVTAVCGSSQPAAAADAYPSRRITLVIPYPAGGATDVLGRLLANKAVGGVEDDRRRGEQVGWRRRRRQRLRGQGAARRLHRAARHYPDHSGAEPRWKLPYDVFKDLAPVTQAGLSTIVLVVPEQQPIKSVKELIDYAKANPGKPYGTFGNATTSHLYGELLKKVADIDMTHVPYRGSAPLTNDLLANTVTSAFQDLTTASAQIKAGKLRALAVGGEKRRTGVARRADDGRTRLSRF